MPPSDESSVTQWLGQMTSGDDEAAQKLWERFLDPVARLADRVLGDAPRGAADEEDVAVEAMRCLIENARRGIFPRLNDRKDLWQVIVMITKRKAIEQRRRERAQKRGGGGQLDEQQLNGITNQDLQDLLADKQPGPDYAAQFVDETIARLGKLDDPVFRKIALDKLANFTNREIASRHDISLRAVERKLQLIRRLWIESRED